MAITQNSKEVENHGCYFSTHPARQRDAGEDAKVKKKKKKTI